MSEQTKKLIELINEGKTCNEICAILKISNKQLYNNLTNLKNKGLIYRRKYYQNGVIVYKPIHTIHDLKKNNNNNLGNNDSTIITSHDDTKFRALVISDLHFGNELERLDLVNRTYNYCIKKGINIILCGGDFIDGGFTKGDQKFDTIYEQIDYFIKKYPFDKNILTFGVGGNHDISALERGNQDFLEIIRNYRHDIVISNYNNSFVNIKNDQILLHHRINNGIEINRSIPLIFRGHYHKYAIAFESNGTINVSVPALCSINESFPTAIEVNLSFKKGYIEYVNLKQIYFGNLDVDYILNENSYKLSNREVEIKPINNEEKTIHENLNITSVTQETIELDTNISETKEPTKTLIKKYDGLSQIEKFNLRYGLK
ncbi:MAG: metallophosphoesterase [Bacilli bacterium]|nr:metallophosphoesterase [Bacilli bacterium]